MSAEKGNLTKRKQDLKGGFGLERCSNPECSQVFHEESEDYWKYAPRKMICTKCESEVVFHGAEFSSNKMNRIIYTYWCDLCKEEYRIKIPMSRKYCGVCKIDWYRSRSYHLRSPLPPHDAANTCIPLNPGEENVA